MNEPTHPGNTHRVADELAAIRARLDHMTRILESVQIALWGLPVSAESTPTVTMTPDPGE